MAKQMTRAQLVDENIALRAQLDVLERQLREAQAQPAAPVVPSTKAPCATYYEYVAKARRSCRIRGITVSYKTRDQWEAAVAAYQGAQA